jgi:YD repeat-containing protein
VARAADAAAIDRGPHVQLVFHARELQGLDGADQPIATYTYDAGGDLIRQDNANGTFTTYSYDADGNPLRVVNHAPGGAINSEFDGSYNPLNLLVTLATPDGSWSYSYDAGNLHLHATLPENSHRPHEQQRREQLQT